MAHMLTIAQVHTSMRWMVLCNMRVCAYHVVSQLEAQAAQFENEVRAVADHIFHKLKADEAGKVRAAPSAPRVRQRAPAAGPSRRVRRTTPRVWCQLAA